MKSLQVVVLVASLLVFAHAFPGAKRNSDEVSAENTKEDGGAIVLIPDLTARRRSSIFDELFEKLDDSSEEPDDDDDESMPGVGQSSVWRNPLRFDQGFYYPMTSLKDYVNKLKAQMLAAFEGFKGGSLTPWGKVPEGANTTSTTKIIGGHAVTINETTYSNGDESGSTIFRVRVVDVKPVNDTDEVVVTPTNDSSEETEKPSEPSPAVNTNNKEDSEQLESQEDDKREETTPIPTRSVETVEEFNNEIPKSQVETLTA